MPGEIQRADDEIVGLYAGVWQLICYRCSWFWNFVSTEFLDGVAFVPSLAKS